MPPAEKQVDIGEHWSVYVSEVLLDVMAATGNIAALQWAAANYFLKIGKLTSEQLTTLGVNDPLKVVIPKWLKFSGIAGEMIVAKVTADMVVDARDGAIERDKLCKVI